MFFSVYTLGCKLNQLETEAITDSFIRQGFRFIPWELLNKAAEENGPSGENSIIVINTCTVTSMAEQKARRVIRKALRDHAQSCIIVTGCYAQMDGAALTALENAPSGRLFVIPGDKKDRLLDLPRFLANPENQEQWPVLIASWLATEPPNESSADRAFRFTPEKFSSHSRGFLKIQDGCDRRCAYCRVSLARGESKSLAADEALRLLLAMEERGIAEAVLTGVNISQYHSSRMGLFELLDFLISGTRTIRLRLSSFEPWPKSFGNEDVLIKVLENQRVRPHFHLSMQSGSAKILERMSRPYTPEDIEETVSFLRRIRRDPFLACDIIAGFPGETEEAFAETRVVLEKIGFAWIHAFPFSPRPGTAAFDFSGKVSEKDTAVRAELLTGLARKGRREYVSRWLGEDVEAVVEASNGTKNGFEPAVSENYLKLLVNCAEKPKPGALIRCRILPPADQQASRMAALANSRFDAIAERTG